MLSVMSVMRPLAINICIHIYTFNIKNKKRESPRCQSKTVAWLSDTTKLSCMWSLGAGSSSNHHAVCTGDGCLDLIKLHADGEAERGG